MQKEIRYNGFTEQPSDYECPDGDLAAVSGLVPEDEALRPIAEPQPLFTLPDGCLISYIHAGIGYKHYIIKHEYDEVETGKHYVNFVWLDAAVVDNVPDEDKPVVIELGEESPLYLIKSFEGNITTYKVDGIGNTIVILTDSGMHYCLWNENTYNYLGNHLPELSLSFGLQRMRTPVYGSDLDLGKSIHNYSFNDEEKRIVTNHVFGNINKWINDNKKDGYFIFPFLVRYAYRLYDGSLTMHSAPILMIPNTRAPRSVFWRQGEQVNYKYSYKGVEEGYALDYAYVNIEPEDSSKSSKQLIQEWSDIIQSIDIFISTPFQSFDQNGEITGTTDSAGNVMDYNKADGGKDYSVVLQRKNEEGVTYDYYGLFRMDVQALQAVATNDSGWFYIPMKSDAAIFEEMANCHTFYFLKSIAPDELSTNRQMIVVSEHLPTLQQEEVMSDDWDSHDQLVPQQSFVYNQRLNLSGITKEITRAFNSKSALCFSNNYLDYSDTWTYTKRGSQYIDAVVFLNKDGKDVLVQEHGRDAESDSHRFGKNHPIPYYYYPDKDAYKVVMRFGTLLSGYEYRQLDLKPHPYLNGAYFVCGYDDAHAPGRVVGNPGATEQNRIISLPNRIYTSEVNNPFAFPVKGITTIGTGSIMGIKAAVKALSPSQFGQFPLYAFSTDGVWALTVKSDGSYSASQPITLDVCISADSITQIESAVLFSTQRGIMLISGSTSTCISDNINSKLAFDLDTLTGVRQLVGEEIADSLDHVHFIEYLQQARMLFDYTHQRIVVYNPNHNYAYAYSLKSKQWGMLLSYIKDAPNSYPDALAFAELPTEGGEQTNTILNYSAEKADADYTGTKKLIITRPLKLDIADQLKTIDTIIQRGQFRKGHVKTILYGSRDLFNWQLIYSSSDHYLRGFRGTPYKYFRIVLLCEGMTPDESIFGCSVQYTPRLTGKLR